MRAGLRGRRRHRDRHRRDRGHVPRHARDVRPVHGPAQLIFAFEAIVIGGAGSLWGTLIGGIVLGVAQNLGSQVSPQGFLIAGHAVFFVVLAARFGLAGRDPRTLIRALRKAPA
jgi:branched-chain amino acid transport system permease protein